jgi:hypothetical protein
MIRQFVSVVLAAALLQDPGLAYDGYGKSNPNITDPGVPARFLWEDVVEDGHTETIQYVNDGDHLASIVANLNYAAWKPSYASGDFDGNGCMDLAIGIPYATVLGVNAAGKVRVVFYNPTAPPPPGGEPGVQPTCTKGREEVYSLSETELRRRMSGMPGAQFSGVTGAFVGFSLAAGDFNCDGTADLAVGAPGLYYNATSEGMPWPRRGGGVFIGYGRLGIGLDFDREPVSGELSAAYTFWGKENVPDRFKLPSAGADGPMVPEFALHGFSLAAGRFFQAPTNCQMSDLAIGVPGQNMGSHPLADGKKPGAGMVTVIAGSTTGLRATAGVVRFNESHFGFRAGTGHLLGFSLAAGRFTSTALNGFDSLAIGAPGFDNERGRVYIVQGSVLGPVVPAGSQKCISQAGGACLDAVGNAEDGDRMGFSLASADFNGDGFKDLAIGNPGEKIGDCCFGEGAVSLAAGSAGGLVMQSENLFANHPDPFFNLQGAQHERDALSFSLAAADFNGDGFADLAIGVPGRDEGTQRDAGAVVVKYGGCQGFPACNVGMHQGLSATTTVHWLAREAGSALDNLAGSAAHNDLVGAVLAVGDLDRTGRKGLIIGAPGISRPEPTIAPLMGVAAVNFRTYSAHGFFVPSRVTGLDASLQQEILAPMTDTLRGEQVVVFVPKLTNFSMPGIIDMFKQGMQAAISQAPNGVDVGSPRFSVVDSLVPHPPGPTYTYDNMAVFYNAVRFEIPISGVVRGTIRGYINARVAEDNSIVVFAAWEPTDFSWFVKTFAAGKLDELNGSQVMKIRPADLGISKGTITHVQLLPSMELEIGGKL